MKIKAFVKAAAAAVIAMILCGCFADSFKKGSASLTIISQPSDVHTHAGQHVTFEVAAQGDGLTYQWYYKKSDSAMWIVWKEHNTAKTSATANDTWGGMRVYCQVKDSHGRSVATRSASISLGDSVTITRQPRDVTVNPGEPAYFQIKAKGKKLHYQWYYRKGNSRLWIKWKGHTESDTSGVANVSWKQMKVCCLVTDRFGNSVLSQPASVNMTDMPTVISQPQSAPSSDHGRLSFSTAGGTEGLVYQWFFVPYGMKWGIKMSGRTDKTLTIKADDSLESAQIYCRLKSPGGKMIFSRRVTVSTNKNPIVRIVSGSEETNKKMTFEVSATEKMTACQWYILPYDSVGRIKLTGQNTRRISLPRLSSWPNGSRIMCGVIYADGDGQEILSAPLEIPMISGIVITSQPKDELVSTGTPATFSAKAEGNGIKYQWYVKKADMFGLIKLVGQTQSTFTGIPDSSWHNMRIICRVSDKNAQATYSRAATATVNGIFTLKASPANITARSGETTIFSVSAEGRALEYQWMQKAFGSDKWQIWNGMTDAAISLPAQTDWHKMNVRCDVRDGTGKIISSKSARVWITDALDILRQPRSLSLRAYEPAEFSVIAQGKGLRYQWYYKKEGMHRWNIWKKHTSSVTCAISNPTWDGMRVMCVITDSDGNRTYSNDAKVRITK